MTTYLPMQSVHCYFILQGTGSGGSIRYGSDTRLFLFNAHHFL